MIRKLINKISSKIKFIKILIHENGIYGIIIFFRFLINTLYSKIFFGRGVDIDTRAHIWGKKYIHFGKGVICGPYTKIRAFATVDGISFNPNIVLGNNVTINDCSHIAAIGNIIIKDNTHIGSKCLVIDHAHGKYSGDNQSSPYVDSRKRILTHNDVEIGSECWIADGVAIMPGVKVGNGCIIGSNSIVLSDIPDYVIAVGNPAKPIKKYDFATCKWIKY